VKAARRLPSSELFAACNVWRIQEKFSFFSGLALDLHAMMLLGSRDICNIPAVPASKKEKGSARPDSFSSAVTDGRDRFCPR
jgi:hypothetical protein